MAKTSKPEPTTQPQGIEPEGTTTPQVPEQVPPPAAPAKPKVKAQGVPALRIRAVPENGFCRAGRRWAREEVTVPASDFTPEQVEALKGERNLVVLDTTLEAGE